MSKILIVDDDTAINNMLKETLEKNNYTCMQAFSGTEAILLLKQENFDLMLLDLMLPGISGEEVLKKTREEELMQQCSERILQLFLEMRITKTDM